MEKEVTLRQFINFVYKDFESNKQNLVDTIKQLVPNILVTGIELTGSYAQGSPTEESDIDLLVKYKGDTSPEEVSNKLRNKLYGYGGIYDVVPIKEQTEGLPFLRSLVEARVFRYESDFSNKSVAEMAKVLYLLMLLMEAIRIYDSEYAKKYARDTFVYGDFSGIRSYATDLHNIIASLMNHDIRSKMKNDNGLSIPEFAIKRYFRDLMTGTRSAERSLDRQFFYQLQSSLKISGAELTMIRRNLVDAHSVTDQEYRDMVERINRLLDNIAIYTDLHWYYKTKLKYEITKPRSTY